MTSPSVGWLTIVSAVAEAALADEDPEELTRRLLRGLMSVHGLVGAMVGRKVAGDVTLQPIGFVGCPKGRAIEGGEVAAWARAAVEVALPEGEAPDDLLAIADASPGCSDGVLLVAGSGALGSERLMEDARDALRLAIRMDDGHARRQSEREERDRLASIIEATEAGTWEWHVPSGRARMNRRWCAMIGRDLDELEPLSVDTWVSSVHPDDLPRCVQSLEDHLADRSDRYEAIYRMRHRDGSWIWVQDRGKIVRRTSDGRPEWMVGSHSDVSSLKHYEGLLQSANDSLRTREMLLAAAGRLAIVGAWTYQPGDEGPMWSDVVCAIHEVEPGHVPTLDEAIGYYCDTSRTLIEDAVRQCLDHGTPWDLELEIQTAKGRRRWVRALGEAERSEGRIVRILGAFQDITERRTMQDALVATNADLEDRVVRRTKELALAKQAAEEASHAKDEFLTNISHELRSPLHSILGFTGLVLDDLANMDPPTIRRFVEKSRASASDLLRLVNDLLDAAKIESGRLLIQPEPVDLARIVSEVAGEFEVAAGNKALTLDIRCPEGLVTHADPARLGQAIRNVMANAVRFSPSGGTIRLAGDTAGASLLRLRIEDEGPGIPEQELEAVFDRFTQSSRTKTGAGGTGLGLPIARGIVELHGGRLWAERPPSGGSAFCFELPAA